MDSASNLIPITPLPIPPGVARVVLFGGSFDPPHKAHIELAARARDEVLGKDAWLVFVPASRSPHKENGPSAPDLHRVAMLRLAVRGVANSAVWTDEVDRAEATSHAEPSYSIDTARRLRKLTDASATPRLLLGSDQTLMFHRWRQPRELIGLAEPIVMLRAPHRTPDAFLADLSATRYWTVQELAAWSARVAPIPVLDESSTRLRALLGAKARPADGDQHSEASASLDESVCSYIREHRLYGTDRSSDRHTTHEKTPQG